MAFATNALASASVPRSSAATGAARRTQHRTSAAALDRMRRNLCMEVSGADRVAGFHLRLWRSPSRRPILRRPGRQHDRRLQSNQEPQMIRRPVPWPNGAKVAVAITFDMDADSLVHLAHPG